VPSPHFGLEPLGRKPKFLSLNILGAKEDVEYFGKKMEERLSISLLYYGTK
jgi:hypothetical protein